MEGCAARASIPASSPCTWLSTITRAWPSPRCSPIRRPKPPSASCTRRSTSLPATASAYAPCLPTTAQATAPTCSAQLAKTCSSNTAVPSPTHPELTAKPNASSKPRCANGPMPNTGPTQSKETPTCSPGPTTTTTSGLMVASATSRPSADPNLVQRLDHLQAPNFRFLCLGRVTWATRRMKVFDSTMDLLAAVGREAKVELNQLFALLQNTREHEFLFGRVAHPVNLLLQRYRQEVRRG